MKEKSHRLAGMAYGGGYISGSSVAALIGRKFGNLPSA